MRESVLTGLPHTMQKKRDTKRSAHGSMLAGGGVSWAGFEVACFSRDAFWSWSLTTTYRVRIAVYRISKMILSA